MFCDWWVLALRQKAEGMGCRACDFSVLGFRGVGFRV